MDKKISCSVLITSYDSAAFIENTLHSIFWQTFQDLEILIVDNNSQDNTVDIIQQQALKDSRITLYKSTENLWPYKGLNFLLEKAQWQYVAIFDHDDIWHPNKLHEQISFLEKNPSYVWCGSTFLDVWEGDDFGKYELFTLKNVVMHSSLVFRNKGYRYNADLERYSDRDMMIHILAKDGPIYHMNPVFLLRRIRRASKNYSVKEVSLQSIVDSKEKSGVSFFEYAYNVLRFKYTFFYKAILHICMPWKITTLTKFVKNPLRSPYAAFVLKAFE